MSRFFELKVHGTGYARFSNSPIMGSWGCQRGRTAEMASSPKGTRMDEFSYIIFSRWTHKPCAYGCTEQRAWQALVRHKFPDRYLSSEVDFKDPTVHQFRIDHKAIACGTHGSKIWTQALPLNEAERLMREAQNVSSDYKI